MKKIWFAIVFILTAVLLCTYEQVTVKSAYTEINAKITAAENAESTEEKLQHALEAAKLWEAYYKKVSLFSNHAVFEGTDLTFKMINEYTAQDEEQLDELIIEAKSELAEMYAGTKISLSNIF